MSTWANNLSSQVIERAYSLPRGERTLQQANITRPPIVAVYSVVNPRQLVQMNIEDESDELDPREAVLEAAGMRDSPSTDAKISNYLHIQKESRKDAVFNNRPIKLSCPPIGMYHPVFAKFCAKMAEPLENFDFDSDELCQAASLFMVANEIYESKDDRRDAYASLQTIWRKDMRHREKIPYTIEGTPMTITPDRYSKVTCPLLPNGSFGILSFEEMENELGTGNSDPLTRAECDYVAMVTSDEPLHTRQSSCCPTLLLGWAGPYLTVSGAVFTDKLITQRLTPDYIYLGPRPSTTKWTSFDHGVHKVAQVLRIIKQSLDELSQFYIDLKPVTQSLLHSITMTHPPHFQCYRNGTETFQLTYTQDLVPEFPDRAVFEAEAKNCETGEVTTVAVKFTNKYGRRGHELLAQNSLAPALRFCERVDDVGTFVVVMDFAEGESDDIWISDERQVELLRQGMNILHAEGLVWGDLRWPNVLADEATGNITLIDLDWCGIAGEACYPIDINFESEWHPSVRPGGKIEKEHDRFMFKLLTGKAL